MAIFDLTKKVEFMLEKRGLDKNIKARVGFAIDVSGSMEDEFASGLMENIAQRVFALAYKFDDDGCMDAWAYDNTVTQLEPATMSNIDGYMRRQIVENHQCVKWHGTDFTPPMASALGKWFPKPRPEVIRETGGFLGFGRKKVVADPGVTAEQSAHLATQPSILVFLTDGDNSQEYSSEMLLREAQDKPVYINFLGVGTDTTFAWIKRMGEKYPNVGFFSVRNIRKIDDDALYEGLVSEELATWLKQR